MSSFFVGQRVRIVWVHLERNASMVGREGRIIEISDRDPKMTIHGLDISPIRTVVNDGMRTSYGYAADQLEPIIPDGAKPSEFSYQELMDRCREGVAA